jgi:UDP-hydrolysing UDP-N-acetyl-D-glucosamine 2-epimerase
MRNVAVVVTARPSYARIKSALHAIADHRDLNLQLVVAASALLERYGSAVDVIERDGFEVAARVYMVVEGENLVTSAKSTGLGLAELATVFDNIQPDVVVTVADRYETLATAAAAAYCNIPLAHVQGGEVTGSIDEKVRHAVTKLADVHFVSNERAAENVRRMGERAETVHVTGGPDIDLAAQIKAQGDGVADVFERFGGVGEQLDLSEGYVVVVQHPVTTSYAEARRQVWKTLEAMHQVGLPTLWFWPNVDAGSDGTSKGIRIFREQHRPANMHFFRNLPPEDFLHLVTRSSAIVGNSSVALRECSFLGVPAVDIGDRQSGRDRGANVVNVPYERGAIVAAVRQQIAHGAYPSEPIYGDGRAGPRIADLLARIPLTIEKKLCY